MGVGREGTKVPKAELVEQTARGVVAAQGFGVDPGEAEGGEGVACDEPRGFGAKALVPVCAGDDEAEFGGAGRRVDVRQADGADAGGGQAWRDRGAGDDGPADGGAVAEAAAVGFQPCGALGDRGGDGIAGEGGGFGVGGAGEPSGDVGLGEGAEVQARAGVRRGGRRLRLVWWCRRR